MHVCICIYAYAYMHMHICICIYAYAPLIATENPPGNLTKKAGQKRCFAKISGSKNPIGPSPRLIIPGRRDASAVGYEFSVAKFFESKPRSRFFGSPARARFLGRFYAGKKVLRGRTPNFRRDFACGLGVALALERDARGPNRRGHFFRLFSFGRVYNGARACFLGRFFWVGKTYAKRLQS